MADMVKLYGGGVQCMVLKRYAEGRVYRAFREVRYVCVGGRG